MTDNKKKTYLDMPDREKTLTSNEAKELLSSFPKEIKSFFVECYLNSNYKKSDLESVKNYLLSNCEMAKLIKAFPGSAEAFEYLYLEKKSKYPFDKFFLKSKAGHQVYQRLLSLDKHLLRILNQIGNTQKLIIDNIFSGPGRDMLRVVEQNPELKNKVNVRNIDVDKSAIAIGEKIARERGLDDIFSFVCKPYNEAQTRQADLIILVGVLCPLNLHVSESMLEKIKKFSKQGGYIVYSTVQYNLLRDDPLTDYLMRLVGWHMYYKSDKEAWDLAMQTGWEPIEQFFDEPLHHHCMTFARLK